MNYLNITNFIKENNYLLSHMLINQSSIESKQIINQFINIPRTKIETYYDKLLTKSIEANCFYQLKKVINIDFKQNFIVKKLIEIIQIQTQFIYINKLNYTNGIKEMLNLLVLKELYLNQIRFDSNIWFNIDSKFKKKSTDKYKTINFSFLLWFSNFEILKRYNIGFNKRQELVLKTILNINSINSIDLLIEKLDIKNNDYIPLRYLFFEKEKQLLSLKINKKENNLIVYNCFLQMIAIFIKENINKKLN